MLNAVDVEAYPALLLTRDEGTVDTEFCALQFNHMIVYVPIAQGKALWVDPTAKECKLGHLPWRDEDVEAWVLRPDKGEFIRTPASDLATNGTRRILDGEINVQGDLEGKTVITYTGERERFQREFLKHMQPTEQKEFWEKYLGGRCPGAVLREFTMTGLDRIDDTLRVFLKFSVLGYAQQAETMLLFSPLILVKTTPPDWASTENRVHPIVLDYKEAIFDSVNLRLPVQSLDAKTIPNGRTDTGVFASFRTQYGRTPEGLACVRELCYRDLRIGPGSYPGVKTFFSGVSREEKELVCLSKKK